MSLAPAKTAALVSAFSVLALGLAACSDDKTDAQLPTNLEASSGTTSAAPSPVTTEEKDDGNVLLVAHFEYATLTVKPGATIVGKDGDQQDHTITSKTPGLFDVTVSKGDTATFTAPTSPGTYDLICRFHPSMAGKLIVQA